MDFAVLADHRVKRKENEKMEKYLDLAREQKVVKYEGDGDTDCGWRALNDLQKFKKKSL